MYISVGPLQRKKIARAYVSWNSVASDTEFFSQNGACALKIAGGYNVSFSEEKLSGVFQDAFFIEPL